MENTITKDTLNQEMVIAANAHRDNIQRMTAVPSLVMDDTRLQLRIRCAAAEEKAEDLQLDRQVLMEKDSEGEIASLKEELADLRSKLAKLQEEHSGFIEVWGRTNDIVRKASQRLDQKLRKVNLDHDRMKRAAKMDEDIMVGLKKKFEMPRASLKA
jgi:hypothetical protein